MHLYKVACKNSDAYYYVVATGIMEALRLVDMHICHPASAPAPVLKSITLVDGEEWGIILPASAV